MGNDTLTSWFEREPWRATAEIAAARRHMIDVVAYPTSDTQGHWFVIVGRMVVTAEIDGDEVLLGEVPLRFIYPSTFPVRGRLPDVYDDAGTFPREAKGHVFPDGSLCLGVLKPGDGDHAACHPYSFDKLASYVRVLLAQKFVFENDKRKWPGEEYRHDSAGMREAGIYPFSGNNGLCPCRSGRKFKHCCMRKLPRRPA